MLSVKLLRPRHARVHLSLPRSFRGRIFHAFLLPFVVVATAELVALAVLPPILALGRAAQLADSKLLGSSNTKLVLPILPERSTVFAADGSVLATLFQDENRLYVPLSGVAPIARQAILAVEDHTFHSH